MSKIPNRPSLSAFATERGWEVTIRGKNYVSLKCDGLVDLLKEQGLDEFGKPLKYLLVEPAPVPKRGRGRPSNEVLQREANPGYVAKELLVEPALLNIDLVKEDDGTDESTGSTQVFLTEEE